MKDSIERSRQRAFIAIITSTGTITAWLTSTKFKEVGPGQGVGQKVSGILEEKKWVTQGGLCQPHNTLSHMQRHST